MPRNRLAGLLISLFLLTLGAAALAQPAPTAAPAPYPATPGEVVKAEVDLLEGLAFGNWPAWIEKVTYYWCAKSEREYGGDLENLILLAGLTMPTVETYDKTTSDTAATVGVIPKSRQLTFTLVKEDGQWRIDMEATFDSFPPELSTGMLQPAPPPTASPDEVVKAFVNGFEVRPPRGPHDDELEPYLTVKSRDMLWRYADLFDLGLHFPIVETHDITTSDTAATIGVTPTPRQLTFKLVKEDGQWRIDLPATLDSFPPEMRPAQSQPASPTPVVPAPYPATPDEVVKAFVNRLGAIRPSEPNVSLKPYVIVKSRGASWKYAKSLYMALTFPAVETHDKDASATAATVGAIATPRPLIFTLVKEDGEWRIDLQATLDSFPPLLRPNKSLPMWGTKPTLRAKPPVPQALPPPPGP
ncbi:MAG TPA: hypothetical protein VGM19_14595 [Armatimonadota bacterium]|jgi:hypothetical protein